MRNKLVEKYIKSRMRNIAVLMCMAVGITSFQLPVLAGEILDNEEVQTINDDISGTKDRSADNYAEDFVTSVSESKTEYTDESDTLSEISENELGQVISENSASDNEVAAGISGIADPRIEPDSSMEAGQKVTWDCIWFGSYWQEDTTGDGIANENDRKQPIKWRVLNVEDNDIFLIADKQLDCQAYLYNASGTSGTTNWGGSTVRSYLNSSSGFLSNAFTEEERECIKTVGTDKVYILSIEEYNSEKYGFYNSDSRITSASDFAKGKYAKCYHTVCNDTMNNYSWTRTPTSNSFFTYYNSYVDFSTGRIDSRGMETAEYNYVRPCIHIDITKNTLLYAGTVCSDGTVNEIMPKPILTSNIQSISDPRIVPDSSMKAGQKVTWDCIWFGSYPQAEVVADKSKYTAIASDILKDGDLIEDAALYSKLQNATYNRSNETTIDGTRYRRMKQSDATYVYSNSLYFYNWSYSNTYHYFKYEPIKWRVIEKNSDHLFLLADKGLDDKKCNEEYTDVTWETCTLRSYLNSMFYDKAFNIAEKSMIKNTTVENVDNIYNGISGGNDTTDKVFLLSEKEVFRTKIDKSFVDSTANRHGFVDDYVTYDEARMSRVSTYARAMGTGWNKSYKGNVDWWLRSPACLQSEFSFVINNGGVWGDGYVSGWDDDFGFDAYYNGIAVRPALKINLSSLTDSMYAGTVCSDGTVKESIFVDDANQTLQTELEQELLEKVRMYCDAEHDTDYLDAFSKYIKQVDGLNVSGTEKVVLYQDYFTHYGITDIHEGIEYLVKLDNAHRAFGYLTTNENYVAYAQTEYLASHQAANIMLNTQDVIYNDTVTQFFKPSTYITGETEEIKAYKGMLLEFMNASVEKMEVESYINTIDETLKNSIKVIDTSLLSDKDYKDYIDALKKCKSNKEIKAINNTFGEQFSKVFETSLDGKKVKIHTSGYNFWNEILEGASFGITCFDDLSEIARVESKVEILKKFDKFLQEVEDGEGVLPDSLRVAACKLRQEITQPYFNEIMNMVGDIVDTCTDDIGFDVGSFISLIDEGAGGFMETFSLAKAIADSLTGIGSFCDNTKYVRAYSLLGMYYSNLLYNARDNFRAEESVANAWEFYDKYQMLFKLREAGENAYLDLISSSKAVELIATIKGMNEAKTVIQDIFDFMNNSCIFELDNIEQSNDYHMYASKAIIRCPVAVEIYNNLGERVYVVPDGIEIDEENEYGRFMSVYNIFTKDYEKIIYLNDDNYVMNLVATSEGMVSVETASMINGDIGYNIYSGFVVEKEDNIVIDLAEKKYRFKADIGDLIKVANDKAYDSIERIKLPERIELYKNQTKRVVPVITPSSAKIGVVYWYSSDEAIASVSSNGLINAKSNGTAVITVYSGGISSNTVVEIKDTPGGTSSEVPSGIPSGTPSDTPSDTPSGTPSRAPSEAPSGIPTGTPSSTPTGTPSDTPSNAPESVMLRKEVASYTIEYSKSVSYNAASHIENSGKASASKTADIIVKVYDSSGNLLTPDKYKVKFKNNRDTVAVKGKQPYFTIALKGKMDSATKAVFKSAKFEFSINPCDLNTLTLTPTIRTTKNETKIAKLTYMRDTGKKISLKPVKNGKGDYEVVSEDAETFTIKGINNYTGTAVLHR